MSAQLARLAVFYAAVSSLWGGTRPSWTLTRSEHFELYSQLDAQRTEGVLNWFEEARSILLRQSIVRASTIPPVRIIVFASAKEYEPYRARAFSDGSYAGAGDRHYITMFSSAEERRVAAHELAHVLLASGGASIPLWLSEGLAEFFSTLRPAGEEAEIGNGFPAHGQMLERRSWIPLADLLQTASENAFGGNRERGEMFYAESWLLADMLVLSPRYGSKFQELWRALASGKSADDTFRQVYGEALEETEQDLRAWMRGRERAKPIRVKGAAGEAFGFETVAVAEDAVEPLLADMLAAAGEFDRAGALLKKLAEEQPRNAGILAALGAIALRQGNAEAARDAWKQALARGLSDAEIAYRYALLADAAGLPQEEIEAALERAVALRPDFDDARYRLALSYKNAGKHEAAIEELRAMRTVAPARAYAYWTALADACNELGRRSEAIEAAHEAARHALTPGERAHAEGFAYIAETDLAVQFARGADGRSEMVTARVPHQSAGEWNPFVEAEDDVRMAHGTLREIKCDGDRTRLRVEAGSQILTLAIADPSRVRMRGLDSDAAGAQRELTCGPQQDMMVDVQYAAAKSGSGDGLVRGIDFRSSPTLKK